MMLSLVIQSAKFSPSVFTYIRLASGLGVCYNSRDSNFIGDLNLESFNMSGENITSLSELEYPDRLLRLSFFPIRNTTAH